MVHQIVAAALVDSRGVLLVHRHRERRHFPDCWDFPGGHVEPGEGLAAALARELREELAVEATISGEPCLRFAADDGTGEPIDLRVWVVRTWTGEPRNAAPEEHDALRWCAERDVASLQLAHAEYAELLSARRFAGEVAPGATDPALVNSAGTAARVDAAFGQVPRSAFLPPEYQADADHDGPVPIGWGQTNSQPRTVRTMLMLLDPQPGDHVLDVGSGSGWTTALLSVLVDSRGRVRGVERVPELVHLGRKQLAQGRTPWATIEATRPGVVGLPDAAPYDRILVSAEAQHWPDELIDQLANPGVLVAPVQGTLWRITRDHAVTREDCGPYRFVPLVEDEPTA